MGGGLRIRGVLKNSGRGREEERDLMRSTGGKCAWRRDEPSLTLKAGVSCKQTPGLPST